MMHRIAFGTLLAASLLLLFGSCGSSGPSSKFRTVYITYSVLAQIGEEKAARTPFEQKLSSSALALFRQYKANGFSFTIPDSVADHELFLQPSKAKVDLSDHVCVYIQTDNIPTKDTLDSLFNQLNHFGVGPEALDSTVPVVQAWVPVAKLDSIAMLGSVRGISFVTEPLINTVAPKGGVRLRADAAMSLLAATNSDGKVRVGVLSDDCGSEGPLADSKTNNRLNSSDNPLAGKDDSYYRSHEGLAMMEIVHDVDPSAIIRFATAIGNDRTLGMITFRKNIQALANEGCKVITDDILYLEEPAFEDGPIAKKIDEISNRVVYISAAGNWAKNVYSFKFDPVPGVTYGSFRTWQTGTVHDLSNGDYKDEFYLPEGQSLEATLQWDDPFGNSSNDFELYLVDVASKAIIAYSSDDQNGDGSKPFEHLIYEPVPCWGQKGYKLYIRYYGSNKKDGSRADAKDSNVTPRMKLLLLGPDVEDDPPQEGSIFGHATSDKAIACAAMYADANYNVTELWSSRGNADIVDVTKPVDGSGNRPLLGNNARIKPDVASLNRVYTSVANYSTFWGTSAAAPHVAGIAALILKANPGLPTSEIRSLIRKASIDYDNDGVDKISGFGRTDAFIAVALARAAGDPAHRFAEFNTAVPSAIAAVPSEIIVPALEFSRRIVYFGSTVDGYRGDPTLELIVKRNSPAAAPAAAAPVSDAILYRFPVPVATATSSFPIYPNIVFTDLAPVISPSNWPVGIAHSYDPLLNGAAAAFNISHMNGTWSFNLRSLGTLPEEVRLKNWGIYIE